MNEMPDFAGFLQRMADEREGAAAEVFDRYADKLVGYARGRMSSKLRQKIDPEEVVQSALKSFFRRPIESSSQMHDWDELWGLLVVITLRKCLDYIEMFGRHRRAINREVSLDAANADASGVFELIDRQPTPAEAAVFTETIQRLMDGLDEQQQQMLDLRIQGHTVPEIARLANCSPRTVDRLLAQLRDELRQQSTTDP